MKAGFDAVGIARRASNLAALRKLVASVSPAARILRGSVFDGLAPTGPSAAIVAPVAEMDKLVAAVTRAGWKESSGIAAAEPADLDALRDEAYAAAEKVAAARAEAIAAASGRHIGALINVAPIAADLVRGLSPSVFVPNAVNGDTVEASAIFTFAFQP